MELYLSCLIILCRYWLFASYGACENWLVFITFQPFKAYWLRDAPTGLRIFKNCAFCPHCIYVFCIYLRTNSDLCHLHHNLIGFYNRVEKCLQHGTNCIFKLSSLRLVFKVLMTGILGGDWCVPLLFVWCDIRIYF
jgi:hypothetical protein